jgi:fido (protein-threonine AMPylation protein)
VRTREWLAGQSFPGDGSELRRVAQAVHNRLFGIGDPAITGRVRTRRVFFGRGSGPNHREGVDPSEVERRLADFEIDPLPKSRSGAARWGARFLQRFFVIHPFEDGNGRVARLLMARAIEHSGLLAIRSSAAPRGNLKYLEALEYAHRHDPRQSRSDDRRDHLRHLARWIEQQIQLVDDAGETDDGEPL